MLQEKWYSAIKIRKSRRKFNGKPLEDQVKTKLEKFCKEFNPFSEVRACIVFKDPEGVFKGIIGTYGKVKGAPAYIAFIGDMTSPFVHEKLGYMGEAIILEATSLGLNTCWVGGFFRPEVVAEVIKLQNTEKVLAVAPVGYADKKYTLEEKILTGLASGHKRKPLTELCSGLPREKWPAWVECGLEAARLAPSAVNRQPWRFQIEANSVTISVDSEKDTYNIPKRLDCGIAMLHFELGAYVHGIKGKWEFLNAPQVAKFIKI